MKAGIHLVSIGVIVGAWLSAAPALRAADLMKMPAGSLHSNVVSIGKKQVPLPTGEWELKFSSALVGNGRGTLGNAERVTALLLQRRRDRYTGAILIRANNEQLGGGGWTRPPHICDRRNVHFNRSDKNYDRTAADCWQVNHLVNTYTRSRNPTYTNMKRWARKNVETTTFLALQFWQNDGFDVLRVDYYVNPAAFGFPPLDEREWKASQWHPSFISGHAKYERAVALLRRTGEKIHPLLQKGFRHELDGYTSDFAFSLRP